MDDDHEFWETYIVNTSAEDLHFGGGLTRRRVSAAYQGWPKNQLDFSGDFS
jgi:hypothetical protein